MGELRGLAGEFTHDGGDGPDKHAGIPTEAALGEELLGEIAAGFFAEAFHLVGQVLAVEAGDAGALAALDVAVGRAGPGGFDADGDEAIAFAGDGEGIAHDGLVGLGIGDELVGGQHHHDGLRVTCGDETHAEGDSRRGIAFRGLGDDIGGGDLRRYLAHGSDLFFIGENENVFHGNQTVEAGDGLRQQGAGAEKVEQLFRFVIAAERPEARAGTTGEDQGVGMGKIGHGDRVGKFWKGRKSKLFNPGARVGRGDRKSRDAGRRARGLRNAYLASKKSISLHDKSFHSARMSPESMGLLL